jgi:hypothetical protein
MTRPRNGGAAEVDRLERDREHRLALIREAREARARPPKAAPADTHPGAGRAGGEDS